MSASHSWQRFDLCVGAESPRSLAKRVSFSGLTTGSRTVSLQILGVVLTSSVQKWIGVKLSERIPTKPSWTWDCWTRRTLSLASYDDRAYCLSVKKIFLKKLPGYTRSSFFDLSTLKRFNRWVRGYPVYHSRYAPLPSKRLALVTRTWYTFHSIVLIATMRGRKPKEHCSQHCYHSPYAIISR